MRRQLQAKVEATPQPALSCVDGGGQTKSRCLLVLGPEATGADLHTLPFTIYQKPYGMNVGPIHPRCVPLGVANVPAEAGYLVTYFALGQFNRL